MSPEYYTFDTMTTATATATATATTMFCSVLPSFTGTMENIIAAGLSAFIGKTVLIGGDELTDGEEVSLDNIHMCSCAWGKDAGTEEQKKGMDIFVDTTEGKQFTVGVDPSHTIAQLKQKLMGIGAIHENKQMLTFGGSPLQNDVSLHGCKMGGGDRIILMSNEFSYVKINKNEFDSQYNYEYPTSGNSGDHYMRGGEEFERPYGCEKYAVKVIGKYESDVWLGTSGCNSRQNDVPGEWPVSYHGTKDRFAKPIVKDGYKMGHRFKHGRGIYSTPTPDIAIDYYSEPFDHKGVSYKLLFMNRVNMDCTKVAKEDGIGTYYVTSDPTQIRPYAILVTKC